MSTKQREGYWIADGRSCVFLAFPTNNESNVLRCLVRHAGEIVSRQILLKEAWGIDNPSEDELRYPENPISSLRDLFGAGQIKTFRREGYQLIATAQFAEPLERAIVVADPKHHSPELRVYPPPYKLHAKGHLLSQVGTGGNDKIETDASFYSAIEGRWVLLIPYDDGEWALKIDFHHRIESLSSLEEEEEKSWWYASIGLAGTAQHEWHPVDLAGYSVLRFDAKAKSSDDSPVFLRFRFKDNSRESRARDGRQSTSWSRTFKLTERYPEPGESYSVDLKELGWQQESWFENTTAVDRSGIHHLVIGYDHEFPPQTGTIFLRNIRFE